MSYTVTTSDGQYQGYTFLVNDITVDAYGSLSASSTAVTITRTFRINKGDKTNLTVNDGTAASGTIYYI